MACSEFERLRRAQGGEQENSHGVIVGASCQGQLQRVRQKQIRNILSAVRVHGGPQWRA